MLFLYRYIHTYLVMIKIVKYRSTFNNVVRYLNTYYVICPLLPVDILMVVYTGELWLSELFRSDSECNGFAEYIVPYR